MKKLIVVLCGLLMFPAIAEVAPIFYEEIAEEQVVEEEPVAEDVATEEVKVVVPVSQPSRVSPRGASNAAVRSGRTTSATTKAVNVRNVATRNAATARTATSRGTASRSATTARTAAPVAARSATTNTRVASRPSRNASAQRTKAVTTRSATTSNKAVAARSGTVTSTAPLYNSNARVGMRSSSAIRSRMPSALSISSTSSNTITSTEEKQEAIVNMDELAQMTDYCKAQYMSCMDNFCNVLDDNQGRCSCSKNIKNYEKTENALKAATDALQDISQQIQYIGLTGDDITTLFTETEAELAMQDVSDTTQLKNDLDNIKDMIVGIKTGTASSSETDMSFDLSGLMNFNIDSTGFDLTGLFGGNNSNTSSISNQRGEQLYKTAAARCKASVLTSCQAQGVDIAVITNSYDLEIDRQCVAYERMLLDSNENMERTVRNAKIVLQKARLMVSQQKNAYDLRGCVNALDSCMQDDFVCGTDYENCLDPTGKYIVNGAVVIGSAPGYFVNNDNAYGVEKPAPLQHTTGLYETWNYENTTDKNAWYTAASDKPTSLAGYIADSISEDAVTETNENMARFLQYKIGYVANNKTYGMCASVLNKCQNYTYKDGEFQNDNQVVREYLQRTLTQIKVAQDEIISNYAASCISDVSSCLNTNQYDKAAPTSSKSNMAINACKAQIVTCMSVNGNASAPTLNAITKWVQTITSEVPEEGKDDGDDNNEGGEESLTCNGVNQVLSGTECVTCVPITLKSVTHVSITQSNLYIKNGSTYHTDSSCSSEPVNDITVNTDTGYNFGGMYTEPNGGGTQCVTSAKAIKSDSKCKPSSEATWYATIDCAQGYKELNGSCVKPSLVTVDHSKNGGTNVEKDSDSFYVVNNGAYKRQSGGTIGAPIQEIEAPTKANAEYLGATQHSTYDSSDELCVDSHGRIYVANCKGGTYYSHWDCNREYTLSGTTCVKQNTTKKVAIENRTDSAMIGAVTLRKTEFECSTETETELGNVLSYVTINDPMLEACSRCIIASVNSAAGATGQSCRVGENKDRDECVKILPSQCKDDTKLYIIIDEDCMSQCAI